MILGCRAVTARQGPWAQAEANASAAASLLACGPPTGNKQIDSLLTSTLLVDHLSIATIKLCFNFEGMPFWDMAT
jgi:hypothetical protein